MSRTKEGPLSRPWAMARAVVALARAAAVVFAHAMMKKRFKNDVQKKKSCKNINKKVILPQSTVRQRSVTLLRTGPR